jgi:hypothetical protein
MRRALLFGIGAACLVSALLGCGIYVTTEALQPPFGQTIDLQDIEFQGANDESFFVGYVIWYKESEDDSYQACRIDTGEGFKLNIPTISDTPSPSVRNFTVSLDDLASYDSDQSFKVRANEGEHFYFAVSSWGSGGEESGKVEFGGQWPSS